MEKLKKFKLFFVIIFTQKNARQAVLKIKLLYYTSTLRKIFLSCKRVQEIITSENKVKLKNKVINAWSVY